MSDPAADLPEPRPADPQFNSLYRRFRPQRFDQVRGQDHVTRALRNAVRDGRVAHAYLFSGPRGTGKTSTARILAMALDCEHPVDGEPCGVCASCVDIRRGSSTDVQELDAASNRKLDEMRDLLSRVALGTRGRWKVYIIDEVHQLTPDAASALLKTLEEPPLHVVFVLATTDPQKVLPTIRSRTLHFEFHLLASEVLGDLLRDVNDRAALGVPPEAIDLVVRRGHGSARDALTVLDQVAAAGAVEDEGQVVVEIVDGLADRDAGVVLTAVAQGMASGRDPRRLAVDILDHLRNGFLATMARGLVMLPDDAVAQVLEQAHRLGLGALVRAMEEIGQALADMRDSVDPRVTLEVALVRLARPEADTRPAALLERIERLERGAAAGGAGLAAAPGRAGRAAAGPTSAPGFGGSPAPVGRADAGPPPTPTPARQAVAGPPPPTPGQRPPPAPPVGPSRSALPPPGPPAGPSRSAPPTPGRPPVGAADAAATPAQGVVPPRRRPAPAAPPSPNHAGPTPAGSSTTTLPSRDELTKAWGDGVLRGLSGRAKAYLGSGRFLAVDADGAVFAVPDKHLLSRGLDVKAEAEDALAGRFGRPVPLKLVIDPGAQPLEGHERAPGPDEPIGRDDLDHLADAGPAVTSPEQRLMDAFPGAEEVSS